MVFKKCLYKYFYGGGGEESQASDLLYSCLQSDRYNPLT